MILQNTVIVAVAAACALTAADSVGLLGPAFLPPTHLAREKPIRAVADTIPALLHQLFQTGESRFGKLQGHNDTALSVQVVSLGASAPVLEYHHNPGNLLNVSAGSTARVDGDSVYRVGSISKLFTAYTLLVNGGRTWWDTPVSEILPELKDLQHNVSDIEQSRWNEVTVGALASQMGGVSSSYSAQDLASTPFIGALAGLPPLTPEQVPNCSNNPSQPPCSREEFFRGYLGQHPVALPYTTAMYANAGYHLLGYVVEALTKSSYAKALQKTVFEPLGLKRSSATLPKKSGVGVIPKGESGWDLDMGGDTPTGGVYSSANDLSEFGKAILGHKQLSPLETRRWMKPHSHTALWSMSVGAPWEIIRTRTRTTAGHPVDLYTKTGDVGLYSSIIILIPDFNVVVSVLAAGSDGSAAVGIAVETVLQNLLPALEDVAREQAGKNLAGTYKPSNTTTNSTLVLEAEDGLSGLTIKEWISNGVDTLSGLNAYAQRSGRILNRISLVPMDLMAGGKHAFRALLETTVVGEDDSVPRINNVNNVAWELLDAYQWGGIGIDEFIFTLDEEGRATGVMPRVMREMYERQ